MALSFPDRNELVLPLFHGLFEVPLWEGFLRRLMARTGATSVHLILQAASGAEPVHRHVPGSIPATERAALAALGMDRLRRNRIYALADLLDVDDAAARAHQDAVLDQAGIGDARLVQIGALGSPRLQLILLHGQLVFSGQDSALLSNLIPALETAATQHASFTALALRAEAAEEALALLGVGQAVLDPNGQVVVADERWTARFGTLRGPVPAAQAQACAELVKAPPEERRLLGTADDALLVRPAARPGTCIAAFRAGGRADPARMARLVAAHFGLSLREAGIAVRLCQGQSLIEAGRALKLTVETTRNYSKRIYTKTGTSGQADLVRRVLGSLAVLA